MVYPGGRDLDYDLTLTRFGLDEVTKARWSTHLNKHRSLHGMIITARCDLAITPRGAIAGHGGLLKLIIRADNRKLLGVHCFGDIASEVVGLGHVVLQLGGRVELFLTLALNTPSYSYAYQDATIDGLTRLTELMGITDSGGTGGAAQ